MLNLEQEEIEFIVRFSRELSTDDYSDFKVAKAAIELLKRASINQYFAVEDCNVGLSEDAERVEEVNREKIAELCKEFGIEPVYQGDPRGITVKLKMSSGFTNDWSREGLSVPYLTDEESGEIVIDEELLYEMEDAEDDD